ncbi:hypothetical protein KJK34_02845 [Flavobacterium sp. D11R37]|uniref:hypothetical protein n=1 Tax=Flavobacterium coralii TaxID=2838017 RepID=UPI001CA6CAB1|nr:hypothetical protein [Flavobacterium coralii]MBY8961684.1 hypothetical protein [Flavobacterium coralii]
MKNKYFFNALVLILSCFCFVSCGSDDSYTKVPDVNEPASPVTLNLDAVPYATLSEYNFFEGDLKNLSPVYKVIPYDLNSELFTDYALKKRFIWMPVGSKATYISDSKISDFPVGTVLIKNFYYNTVAPDNSTYIVETRLMIKKVSGWIFATYVWNDEQTEAVLDNDGYSMRMSWNQNGTAMSTNYKVPTQQDCLKCHQINETPVPVGVKPQNLNKMYAYADGTKNQLTKWIEAGYLDTKPNGIISTVNWQDETQPLELRVRSYLDINCAHCHSTGTSCDYTPMELSFAQNESLFNLGVCREPVDFVTGNQQYIVKGGDVPGSLMHFRMSTTIQSEMMPTLGRTVVHQEGLQLIEDWINSLENTCD